MRAWLNQAASPQVRHSACRSRVAGPGWCRAASSCSLGERNGQKCTSVSEEGRHVLPSLLSQAEPTQPWLLCSWVLHSPALPSVPMISSSLPAGCLIHLSFTSSASREGEQGDLKGRQGLQRRPSGTPGTDVATLASTTSR